jgi:NAD+ synthase (glutamine-hydrolysing)
MIFADVDLERLAQDRMRQTSFADATRDYAEVLRTMRAVSFDFTPAFQ